MKLSKEQLQVIDQHLKDRKVESWDVRYEIVDHIACLVESKMEDGSGFNSAFTKVKMTFTFRYLLKMQQDKRKALSKLLRVKFVSDFKGSIIEASFLLKMGLLFLLAILMYKYASVDVLLGMLLVILYSPTFFQAKGMIKNYKLYGKSMLVSSAWVQLLSIPSMIMCPFYISDVLKDKYAVVILALILCFVPIMLVWNSLLLKEMKKLKEQYFLIYE